MNTADEDRVDQGHLNPTTECDRISPGCDNCYALTLAKRLKASCSARRRAAPKRCTRTPPRTARNPSSQPQKASGPLNSP
jgi:protein gp37